MEWVQLAVALLLGLGVGNWWERRQASREAKTQREHASAEAKATRDHATTEARASRRFQIRLDAYKEASTWLERRRLWVELTEPVMSPAPDPPDVIDDGIEFGGTISVTASNEVRAAMRAAVTAILGFDYAVGEYRRSKRSAADVAVSTGADMQEARDRAVAAIEHAQTVMRDELADL